MPKLADLRAAASSTTRSALPERNYPLCLAQSLVAEVQALEERRDVAIVEHRREKTHRVGDEEGQGRPRRAAEPANPPEVEAINARIEELFDEMRQHTGNLVLRGKKAGDWLRWTGENPPREDSALDQRVTYGICDADALFATLHEYVATWEGDPLGDGDWEFILARAAPGDLQELCRIVVQIHDSRGVTAPPKSRSGSQETAPSSTDSDSPSSSGSPTGDSSDGNPPSDTSTSTPPGS